MTPSHIFRLTNQLQNYAWGSTTAIPTLLGAVGDGRPVAEMWLGAHALGPSMADPVLLPLAAVGTPAALPSALPDAAATPAGPPADPAAAGRRSLADLLRADPDRLLGRSVVEAYGPRLPYLLKFLAAASPLSLQVHPKPHVARAGYSQENAAGVLPDSPERNFKDDQHKPEMLVALTPFEGLCGFRRPARILALLDGLEGYTVGQMRAALVTRPTADGVRAAFEIALSAREGDCTADLARTIDSIRGRIDRGESTSRGDQTAVDLATCFPGDPGALVSLMLNRMSLAPGQAVFLGAGEIHAYLSGVGVEVMASSDNVLRAGLTTKRIDVDVLLRCASYAPRPPEHPVLRAEPGGLTGYRAPVAEFALIYGRVAGEALITHTGPRILLCLDGEVEITGPLGPLVCVTQGESVFIGHDAGQVTLVGSGVVVVAYVPYA
ncbi:mannose-6-phosphate isomerase, type 1 [Sanguibacter gelidistatuariae]|uniref:mannose-6-phosphate isomerase n=1 Tax=Sanguibacter gelidistatuariae TaxID=1814289 RepID=A0A1G6Q3E7_9MICO|nr:mannose-6-phosphate isomerase, class I [Sanguibacter gelidistatuariae]SDC86155.1 mannose-6-phosphate isomerase, type 1 [Sanguibacter gelidistatuariae]